MALGKKTGGGPLFAKGNKFGKGQPKFRFIINGVDSIFSQAF